MKLSHKLLLIALVPIVAVVLNQGCSQPKSTELSSGALSGPPCVVPDNIDGSPQSIEDVVTLINALPKPVTVPCLLSSLDRPLKIVSTNNALSAQPAVGNRSPRIFIMRNPLIISIVPEGSGAKVVEMSFLTSDTTSIKAEIDFPVTANLPPEAPYETIRSGDRTACGTCHTGETQATQINFATAFVSTALQPKPNTLINLEYLRNESKICNSLLEAERCAILRSIFDHGDVEKGSFPSAMPVFF